MSAVPEQPAPEGFTVRIGPAEYALEGLVQFDARDRSNDPTESPRLDLRFTFGLHLMVLEPRLHGCVRERVVRVRVRWCRLTARMEGCRIDPDSRYRWEQQAGAFTVSETVVSERDAKRGGHGTLSASLGAAKAGGVTASTKLEASGEASAQTEAKSREESERKRRIAVVEHAPGDGWRIGIPGLGPEAGDPLRGGYLDGSYFDQPSELYPSTCRVDLEEGLHKGQLHFVLDVYDGLCVQLADRDQEAPVGDRKRVIERMRDKLAAIVVEGAVAGSARAEAKAPAARRSITLERGGQRRE